MLLQVMVSWSADRTHVTVCTISATPLIFLVGDRFRWLIVIAWMLCLTAESSLVFLSFGKFLQVCIFLCVSMCGELKSRFVLRCCPG
jgi:hypothetical protein